MQRFDAAFARYTAIRFGNTDPSKFMPWPREEEPEATPEAALLMLKSVMKVKK